VFKRKILVWTLLLAVLVALVLWTRNEVQTDSCLDRGGSWDAERHRCDGATE